jgi:hypothetical protein
MKTYVLLWLYVAELFLKWEMFQTKFVEKKLTIWVSMTYFRKSYRLWDNVERYDRAGEATDDNIVRRMLFACWTPKATHIHS